MNRRAAIITFGVSVALLLLWFVALWGPQGGKLKDAHNRTDVAKADNGQLELRLSRLKAAQKKAPELMADLERLRRAVPDDPELAQFILDANQAATDAGVDFLSISPGVPEQKDPTRPPVISLGISVNGDYFSVLDYLDRINALPRIVVIDNLSLAPQASNTGELLTVSLTARMFATSAPQIAPTTTTTTAPASQSRAGTPATTSSTVAGVRSG